MRWLMMVLVMTSVVLSPKADARSDLSAPANAIETATGMRYVVLKAGPGHLQTVSPGFIQYRATIRSAEGRVYQDAERDGVQGASFSRLARTMPGLARALLSTPVGESRRWWIEAANLRPGYPGMPDQPHVIDLQVIGNYDPTKAPDTVSAPPATAQRTASGLAYEVLKKGAGGPTPAPSSIIEIHYNGWTTDGKLFDSSIQRDQHAVFPLAELIPGWQEGLQLMSPGDTFRLWIPGHLAYDAMPPRPGMPRGMLVFDITLFSIQ